MSDCAVLNPDRTRWCTQPVGHLGDHKSENDDLVVWSDCPMCGGSGVIPRLVMSVEFVEDFDASLC